MSTIGRPAHVLKPEKVLTIPRYFIFFDTETNQYDEPDKTITQSFKMGWSCFYQRQYGRHQERTTWTYLDSPYTFWNLVFTCCRPKTKLWILARNIVFDFTVVKGWYYLRRAGFRLKFFHNNGVSCIVSVTDGKRSIVFLDTMNWFVESIEKTGQRLGLPKLKIDFNTCTEYELSNYCHRDVEIDFENFKLFIKFLTDNKISRLCYTRASTAMAAYLRNHYKTTIYIHNNKEAIQLERDSYKGGRCECFYIGELKNENYYILDVNSLYPYVMANRLYPVRYCAITRKVTRLELASTLQNYSVVGQVSVETDEPVYAIKRDRLIFPIGYFKTTLTTPELKYAIDHNHLRDIYTVVIYEQANIFRSYVDTFYRLRRQFHDQEAKDYEEICKKLLNSLYGKFGQKAENWVLIGQAPDEPDREEITFHSNPRYVSRIRYLLGEIFELKGYGECFNSFPAIASHVTAYGRIYLWNLIKQAGQDNCFYCDTDSLIVNENGLLNLVEYINEVELGKLKVEDKTQSLVIRGLKDYDTDTKHVTKGIRKSAVKIADNIYEQQVWPTFRGLMKGQDINTYSIHITLKHLSREYTKGIVTGTGKVNPFILTDALRI